MNLQLSITERCNLRCTYCYYKETHGKRSADMSDHVMEDSVRLAIDKCIEKKDPDLGVTFFGGEPLVRTDFIKKTVKFMKDVAKERRADLPKGFKLRFAVNTNGTLLSEETIKFLKREKFDVFISLDGPAKRHDLARIAPDGSGSFKAIAPHIPALVEMNALVLMVVTQQHVKGLADAVKWAFKQGFKKVATALDFNGSWTGADFDALIPEYEKLARFWYKAKMADSGIYLSTIQDKISINLLGERKKEATCFIGHGSLVVAANGNTFPCTRFISSRKGAPYVTGNVSDRQSGIYKGVMPKEVQWFMEHDRKDCDGCAIRYRCLAHECGCTSFYTTGSLKKVSPEVCTHERILCAICDEYAGKLLSQKHPERIF